MERLLKPAEAAGLLSVSLRVLEKWRHAGNGPAFVRLGRQIRYRSDDLAAWVRTQQCQPTPADQ